MIAEWQFGNSSGQFFGISHQISVSMRTMVRWSAEELGNILKGPSKKHILTNCSSAECVSQTQLATRLHGVGPCADIQRASALREIPEGKVYCTGLCIDMLGHIIRPVQRDVLQ